MKMQDYLVSISDSMNDSKNFLVTGASGVLGDAVVQKLLSEGHTVIALSRRCGSQHSPNLKLINFEVDISNYDQVDSCFSTLENQGIIISGVVHTAAILGPIGPIDSISIHDWEETISINLSGTYFVLKRSIEHFRLNNCGNFVALSGGGATSPIPRMLPYGVSKCAVVRLIESVAIECREENISVNSVSPGILDSRMTSKLIASGPDLLGQNEYNKIEKGLSQKSLQTKDRAVALIYKLISQESPRITGRIVSAVWDNWENLFQDPDYFRNEDWHTLRRLSPVEEP